MKAHDIAQRRNLKSPKSDSKNTFRDLTSQARGSVHSRFENSDSYSNFNSVSDVNSRASASAFASKDIARRLKFTENHYEEQVDTASPFLSLASELRVYNPETSENSENETDSNRKSSESFVNLLKTNLDIHRKTCELQVELQNSQRSALTHHFLSIPEMEKKFVTVSKAIEGLKCFLENKDNAIFRLLHQPHPQEWIPVELEDQANFIELLKKCIEHPEHLQSSLHLMQWYNESDNNPLNWAESLHPVREALMLCRLNHQALINVQKHTTQLYENVKQSRASPAPKNVHSDSIQTPPNLPSIESYSIAQS